MFKEAFLGLLCFALLFFICYRIKKQSNRVLTIVIGFCLFLGIIANLIYNCIIMFPDYYMEVVSGTYRYGTFSENLFAYNDEFMYRDTVLFPILRGRNVSFDDSSNAAFYEKFFTLYSDSLTPLSVSDLDRKTVIDHLGDFAWKGDFSCMKVMDYVKDDVPQALVEPFSENEFPAVYIHTDSLPEQSDLAVVVSTDYTVYIMSLDYYKSITTS